MTEQKTCRECPKQATYEITFKKYTDEKERTFYSCSDCYPKFSVFASAIQDELVKYDTKYIKEMV